MGCFFSTLPAEEVPASGPKRRTGGPERRRLHKPRAWKHPEALTRAQLVRMREEFWDTAPHYGGRKEIWDALKLATESDMPTAQAIVDSTGIILETNSLAVCYDERGAKYELPIYVLSEPQNLKDK